MAVDPVDRFVDAMLDDALRRLERERDADRAWWRNECPPAGTPLRTPACAELARLHALRPALRPSALRLNSLRGRCAEQRLVRRLCARGYDVRNQVRVGPRRGGSVLDVSPLPGAPRRLPRGLENKHLHLPAYRGCAGGCAGLCLARLVARVPADVRQVRRHIAQSAASARGGLPARIRLLYQLGGAISDAEFRCAARALYAAVRAANAQPPGAPAVAATVVRAAALA